MGRARPSRAGSTGYRAPHRTRYLLPTHTNFYRVRRILPTTTAASTARGTTNRNQTTPAVRSRPPRHLRTTTPKQRTRPCSLPAPDHPTHLQQDPEAAALLVARQPGRRSSRRQLRHLVHRGRHAHVVAAERPLQHRAHRLARGFPQADGPRKAGGKRWGGGVGRATRGSSSLGSVWPGQSGASTTGPNSQRHDGVPQRQFTGWAIDPTRAVGRVPRPGSTSHCQGCGTPACEIERRLCLVHIGAPPPPPHPSSVPGPRIRGKNARGSSSMALASTCVVGLSRRAFGLVRVSVACTRKQGTNDPPVPRSP